MVAGAARIRVTFQVDADGLLSVSARELGSGVEAAVTVKPSFGLADEQIAQMLKDGFAHAEADMAARSLREAQVDAERMILATGAALAADGALLSDAERAAVQALIEATRRSATVADAHTIEAAVEALATGTEAFAAARMNQGIRLALAGRRLDDI
jgi:molecular chaperone HscA